MSLIVKLRLFKGEEKYDRNGKLISQNQLYKIPYGGIEWDKFKKNVKYSFTNAEVVGVQKETTEEKIKEHGGKNHPYLEYSYEDVSDFAHISAEIKAAFEAPKAAMTPEQRRIAELEAKLDALVNGKKEAPKVEVLTDSIKEPGQEEMEATRKEYFDAIGKKPGRMSFENMVIAINEAKTK